MTGQSREETTDIDVKKTNRRKAERAARDKEEALEQELAQRHVKPPTFWDDFAEQYERKHLRSLAQDSLAAWNTASGHLERIVSPNLLIDVTAEALSTMAEKLREEEKKEPSIATYLRTIKAGLGWANAMGMLPNGVPKIVMPKRAKGITKYMRSRPITGEEFDRLLDRVADIRPNDASQWQELLRGMFWGGLRITEAMALSWDHDESFVAMIGGKYPISAFSLRARRATRIVCCRWRRNSPRNSPRPRRIVAEG